MVRPWRTAATIEAKLSSLITITAASFATSLPRLPMATPMSAAFSAGASLTPSPVTATTSPDARSAETIASLWAGEVRAKRTPPDPHASGGHAVLGERAGLVRADDRDRPERLHRGEPLHEALLADHALDAERQRERERRQQALRDIGNDDAQSEEESLAQGEDARRHAEGEESGAEGSRKGGDHPGDVDHLALERARRLGYRLGELGGDADLRLHGGGAHDEAARA